MEIPKLGESNEERGAVKALLAVENALLKLHMKYNKLKLRAEAKTSYVAAIDILRYQALKEVFAMLSENGVKFKAQGQSFEISLAEEFLVGLEQDSQQKVKRLRSKVSKRFKNVQRKNDARRNLIRQQTRGAVLPTPPHKISRRRDRF